MSNFANILRTEGVNNKPGLKEIGYFGVKSEIDAFPALPSTPDTTAREVTLSGSFTMLADKYFKKIFSTEGNAKVEGESQGEMDNETYLVKASFYFPGTKEEALAFAKLARLYDLVFIFVERDGERRVVGNRDYRTKVKVSDTTGDENTSKKGIMVEIETTDVGPAPLYNGVIPLDPTPVPAIS